MISSTLLDTIPTQLLRATFIICFFAIAGFAIYFHEHAVSRQGFIALFITLLLLSGTTGLYAWPFFNWHLYPGERTTEQSFYELRVVDVNGDELKYDARAAPPILQTPIKRLTKQMATDYTPQQRRETGCFLLHRAQAYRDDVGRVAVGELVKFPRHQFGFQWRPQHITELDRITAVRGYAVTIEISPDGKELERYNQKAAFTIQQNQCS